MGQLVPLQHGGFPASNHVAVYFIGGGKRRADGALDIHEEARGGDVQVERT